MDFCRLSAGSFRFLIHPDPTEAFCLPHGSLTSSIDRLLDLVGVTPFRLCEMQLRRMPSLLRGLGAHPHGASVHGSLYPIHHRVSHSD